MPFAFSRIGASDDLAGGRSTFMVEMQETANILHNASAESLVLMYEIGRGTSTFDGLSLAWACAHYIGERTGALTLFATHYFELTALAEQLPTVSNVHLDAVEGLGDFLELEVVLEPGAGHAREVRTVTVEAGAPLARLEPIPEPSGIATSTVSTCSAPRSVPSTKQPVTTACGQPIRETCVRT